MADLTKTITNNINVFGIEPSNKWGSFDWGENWGYGDVDLVIDYQQFYDPETVNLTDSWSKSMTRSISNTITADADQVSQMLVDSEGYNHIFTKPTSDAKQRALTAFNESTTPSVSWGETSGPSTPWGDV